MASAVPGTVNEPAYRAVNGAKTSGLDIEFNGELTPGWQAALSYSYSRGDQRAENAPATSRKPAAIARNT